MSVSGFDVLQLRPAEHLARRERPAELADQLVEVMLHAPVEPHELAVDVVERLHRRWRPSEKKRRAAGECLDITPVLDAIEQRQQLREKPAFSAGPRNDGVSHCVSVSVRLKSGKITPLRTRRGALLCSQGLRSCVLRAGVR